MKQKGIIKLDEHNNILSAKIKKIECVNSRTFALDSPRHSRIIERVVQHNSLPIYPMFFKYPPEIYIRLDCDTEDEIAWVQVFPNEPSTKMNTRSIWAARGLKRSGDEYFYAFVENLCTFLI